MRGKNIFYFILFLCFSTLSISRPAFTLSEGEKEYRCVNLSQEPILDGRIKDDTGWENALEAGGNFVNLRSNILASKQTFFMAGYTPEAFFIGIECIEPKIENIKAVLGNMESLWGEDSIEIFIFPDGVDTYFILRFFVSSKRLLIFFNSSLSSAIVPLLFYDIA